MTTLDQFEFIDIHYHANPDLYHRRLQALDAGRAYQALNGVVVLNSHLGATSVQATLAQCEGLPVLASLALNHVAGGIDYRVVLRALAEYQPMLTAKMIVHFPTITGRKIQSRLQRQMAHPHLNAHTLVGETLFDDNHQLRSAVIDILKMANDYPIVLSTGHANKCEVYALIEACIQHQVPALLLNQPANPLTGLQAPELADLAKHTFVWIEQTTLTYVLGYQDQDDFAAVLSSLPRVIYSSDLGQTSQMDIKTWHDYSRQMLTDLHISSERQEQLRKGNAMLLLQC